MALTRMIRKKGVGINGFSLKNAVVIGLVQGMAILPGISRSGSTIAVGLFLGLSRETAAKFSFLLSIPAILGATLILVKDAFNDPNFNVKVAVIGTVTSCIIGYLSLRFLGLHCKSGQTVLFYTVLLDVGLYRYVHMIWIIERSTL